MAINPFKRSGGNAGASTPPRKPHGQEPSEGEARDPLDVEDLLVDGSKRASINADGTMTSKSDALKGHQEHIDLVKQREWGAEIQRVKKEQELMSKKFPHFKLVQADEPRYETEYKWLIANRGQYYWLGKLKTYSGHVYGVAMTYPENYPYAQMACYVIRPFLVRSEHRYTDGHLCLYSNDHGGDGSGWDPQTTAVSYVAWVSAWLHAYEIWAKTGRWPGLARFA